MEITDQQRKRAEANRLAALAKRKELMESFNEHPTHSSTLFNCRKSSNPNPYPNPHPEEPASRFLARLEICSPDSFSITPVLLRGFSYPGEEECLRRLSDCLSTVMPSHYTQNLGGRKASVYKVRDYSAVLKSLKCDKNIEIEEIPWATLNVIERLSHSFETERWIPCRPEHFSDEKVDELIGKLPKLLLEALLPFQLDGLKYGLRRGGRCLIADEMGLGKTLQAIAIACCFLNEGSVLVVCPAILRFTWAEELEHWVPFLLPSDIHLVFGHRNNPVHLKICPKVVVISYTMLHRLRKSMLEREWALLIVDESHHVRCIKKASEPGETKAVLDMAARVKHMVLLSGTPSLSRPFDIFHQINMLWPGLLGKTKYEFAKTYCGSKLHQGVNGKTYQDFSKGIRLEELNVLLKQTVMIRRLKAHVLLQLPPKRRQIIRVFLKQSDIAAAKAAVGNRTGERSDPEDVDESDEGDHSISGKLSDQEVGIAKLSGFREWLSIHPVIAESDDAANFESNPSSPKMIIFAHHHKVLNGLQEFICEKGIGFVRIDGNTLARDRQSAVLSFRSSTEIKIAIVGITAGGVGLDFSSAQHVVFLELPQSPSLMLQAEDRAHRRGQKNAVNIYIFCAKDTPDESHWQNLNKSLCRVTCTTNGKYDVLQEIEVERISFLETCGRGSSKDEDEILENTEHGEIASHSGLKDTNPSEAHDEVVDNSQITLGFKEKSSIFSSLSKTDKYHTKANVTSGFDAAKNSISEAKLEGSVSSNIGKVERCSSSKLDEGKTSLPEMEGDERVQVDNCCSNLVQSLRFEVSQYTGRIHLYSCISGTDTRPRPLHVNFRLEELEPIFSVPDYEKQRYLDPFYRNAVLAFSKEWNNLRPVERKKLIGKPLQLPLAIELHYLDEGLNHKKGGLLKIGSKRRRTPLDEISQALPANAVWTKVYLRSGCGKKEKEYTQGWTLTGEPLCKLCQALCKSSIAKTPEFFEDLFCNLECYEEYRIRTSSRSLRQELFQLENGICTNCQLDCHKLVAYIKPLSLSMRRDYIEKFAPKIAMQKKLLDKLVSDPKEGNAWHADHIVAVYQGGGECKLENMRTLCVACHSDVTKQQCAERRIARVRAKKQLKAFMDGLKRDRNTENTEASFKDENNSAMRDVFEDELLVKVPGSSYASGNDINRRGIYTSTSTKTSVPTTTDELQ